MPEIKKVNVIRRSLRGAVAGAAATGLMSVFLGISEASGMMNGQPPRLIVQKAIPALSPSQTDAAALVAHAGFGVSAGILYTVLVTPRWRGAATGAGYGVIIWAISYAGWIPALGIMPSPQKDQPGRALSMFLAHVVYGSTLGAAARRNHER